MAKVRTIKNAYKELHQIDPNTNISESFIRNLVRDGSCPSIKSGNRFLIDLDVLIEVIDEKMQH